MRERRRVLLGSTVLIATVAALVLSEVVWTIALAIATSYVLVPVHRWFLRRGLTAYWSAIVSSFVAIVVSLLLFAPVGFVLYGRREGLVTALQALDGQITLFEISGQPVVFDVSAIQQTVVPNVESIAVTIAGRLASLSAKFTVFVFVVFGVLFYQDKLAGLVYRPLPSDYHDVVAAVHARISDVLFGHYLLALLGAAVTYLLGLVLFTLLGYSFPFALALAVAVFWILPVVNPGTVVFALTIFHALTDQLYLAVAVGVFGAILLSAVPRTVVFAASDWMGQPRRLSSPAYFVGFVGGWLTVGPVGIVVGPLLLAIMLTLRDLLAEDANLPETD
jgi:predicted PurR-regulated permease PerM